MSWFAITFLLGGCSLIGTNPSAPTKFESGLYDTTTNYVATTNAAGLVTVTPQYVETPKASVVAVTQGVGTAVNTFFPGVGGIVSTGLALILGAWGYLRSNKQAAVTGGALTQEIQTILTFVGQLPNGSEYVNALTAWLQAHQNDTDTVDQIAALIAKEVSNTDAKAAANQVIATINSLKTVTTPVPPVAT